MKQVEELMNMLTGKQLLGGMVMNRQPCLSQRSAFSVVWFLQENLHIIPDRYERCAVCEELFDAENDGFIVDGTDAPDCWHQELGVTEELLRQNDGAMFCSRQCEYRYWRSLKSAESKV
jgi:hypothetical protein